MNDLVETSTFNMVPGFRLNRDEAKRNQIIHGKPVAKDAERFTGLSVEKLAQLVHESFIELDERQNESPTVQEFGRFMVQHPEFTCHGYTIVKERDDYRVSIEGLEYNGEVTKEQLIAFTKFCKHADDFIVEDDNLYAWWD